MIAPEKQQSTSPMAHLLGRILLYLEGSSANLTSGGIRNAHLREEIRIALRGEA